MKKNYHSSIAVGQALSSLREAQEAGLNRREWMQLNGIQEAEWRTVQAYMRRKKIEYPLLKGMLAPHSRRRSSSAKPQPRIARAARRIPAKQAETRFEIVVGS